MIFIVFLCTSLPVALFFSAPISLFLRSSKTLFVSIYLLFSFSLPPSLCPSLFLSVSICIFLSFSLYLYGQKPASLSLFFTHTHIQSLRVKSCLCQDFSSLYNSDIVCVNIRLCKSLRVVTIYVYSSSYSCLCLDFI